MKRFTIIAALLLFALPSLLSAQNLTVTGKVNAASGGESLNSVSVIVKGTNVGTFTNSKGEFRLSLPTSTKFPITLLFSSVGYEFSEVAVKSASEVVSASLKADATLGQEVVVSATKTPVRIIESPVSIERVNLTAIRNAPAADYYDIAANLKGVDMVASSLNFKTATTRGFAGSGNTRFTQLIDGMDNQAPGLNFSTGSIIGLSELDVESMGLLQGASSALYGPGGMNGTLLINSKDPFKYQGLSFQAKNGVMHVDGKYRDPSPYLNYDLRYAKKVSDRFAFKITASALQAKDWLAGDERNVQRSGTQLGRIIYGTRDTDPNYDGMNMYGDETSGSINAVLRGVQAQAPFLAPFINGLLAQSDSMVSRTGYHERDVTSPNAVNYKVGGSLNYKLTNSIEAIVSGFWGTGNAVYTATERYSLKNLKMGQYKIELKHNNWLVRAYTTQENAGETYNTTITTRLFNEAWKSSSDPVNGWYKQYGLAYLDRRLNGLNSIDAHNKARIIADAYRPVPGTQEFNTLFDAVRSKAISEGGGRLIDRTNLYAIEGQYNLSHLTGNVVDILVGANYRRFMLNSEGTLFADSANKIPISEFGSYVQMSKGIIKDIVKFTVSGRYDKNENFKGRFTPRATALFKVAKNNNIRLSYQTAYRFPSNQYQYINLKAAGATLIGGIPKMLDYYGLRQNPGYSLAALQQNQFVVQQFGDFKPESVTSYEIGYKGLLADSKLLIDAYGYIGNYQDFLTRVNVVQSIMSNPSPYDIIDPLKRRVLSVPTNSPSKVKTHGWGLSLDYKFNKGFYLNSNISSDILVNAPVGYITFYNTPKYRANVGFGNNGIGKSKRLGFNMVYRWQAEVDYQSDLANGTVPAYHILDAQIGYKFPKVNSIIRLGANNLFNQYYITGLANPSIGGLYYVSFGYNIF